MDFLPEHRQLPLQWIFRDPNQPRKHFEPESIKELSHNIHQVGLLHPLLVQQNSTEHYTLVCGERRWLAAKQIGLKEVPVLIQAPIESSNLSQLIQYSENLFRENLSALESIDLIVKLHQQGLSTQQLAEILGKRHDWIQGHLLANTTPYRALFESGRLRSVAVLLVFRSLPPGAQKKLLTDTGLITSTLCQKMRHQFKSQSGQRELPILTTLPLPVSFSGSQATLSIPFNPQWMSGFNSKQSLIRAIENILNTYLLKEQRQA